MSKTETFRQSAVALNLKNAEKLAEQIEATRQNQHQSTEDLAKTLQPLALALAALTDETRQTLAAIELKSREQSEKFNRQLTVSAQTWASTTARAQEVVNSLEQSQARMTWTHYALVVSTAVISALLAIMFWIWLAPSPVVQNQLDPKAVAEYLKPAVIEALKPSKNKYTP